LTLNKHARPHAQRVLHQTACCLISLRQDPRPVAQHYKPPRILHHCSPVERARRVEAIVAVNDGAASGAFAA
jgi:hypothetical protein